MLFIAAGLSSAQRSGGNHLLPLGTRLLLYDVLVATCQTFLKGPGASSRFLKSDTTASWRSAQGNLTPTNSGTFSHAPSAWSP
jgi:hypothetical protein